MTTPRLPDIRGCLEGIIPSILATSDPAGMPNVSLISHVQFVDPEHVALSYQFFNKTRRNLLATRRASVVVVDPDSNTHYRLVITYLETQTSGPLFEVMRAKLAGIASHSGMQGVFRLLGSDVFKVESVERVATRTFPTPEARNLLSAARRVCAQFSKCGELGELFDALLAGLQQHFGIEHAMILMRDTVTDQLYTVASRGYPVSGVGSEIRLGEGVVGVAAAHSVPIRIGHMTAEYAYGTAVRDTARAAGLDWDRETAIPFPGLGTPQSQIAIPILVESRTIGVLFAESPEANQFGYDQEDALAMVAELLATKVCLLQRDDVIERPAAAPLTTSELHEDILVRHYAVDDTVFVSNDYVIKGVAGAILWKLAQEHAESGRSEYTNRELRLDPSLRLPEYIDNLEARLVLLQRRLEERDTGIHIEKCGRGRFRFIVHGRLTLEQR